MLLLLLLLLQHSIQETNLWKVSVIFPTPEPFQGATVGALNGDGCFGHVGRQDHPTPQRWNNGSIILEHSKKSPTTWFIVEPCSFKEHVIMYVGRSLQSDPKTNYKWHWHLENIPTHQPILSRSLEGITARSCACEDTRSGCDARNPANHLIGSLSH